jgi:co-chaperonin GroES (HSP10)
MKRIVLCVTAVVALASCTQNTKKVLVLSKGKATINKEAKTITVDESTGHEEQTFDVDSGDKVVFSVKSQAGDGSVEFPTNGYYIVNAKNDTIVGGYQNYGAPEDRKTVFTQDDVKKKLDSLKLLVSNQNISAANRNFFILPNSAVKITDNLDAYIVGPYHRMTSVEEKDGKAPEVYRFYSIKEVRETIDKLDASTKPAQTPPPPPKPAKK